MRTNPAKKQTKTHQGHVAEEDNKISPRDIAFETNFNKPIAHSGESMRNEPPVSTDRTANQQFAVDAKKTLKRPAGTNPCVNNTFSHRGEPIDSVVNGGGDEVFRNAKKPRLDATSYHVDGSVQSLERSNIKRVMEETFVVNDRGEPTNGAVNGVGDELLRDVKKPRLGTTAYRAIRSAPFPEGHIRSSREATDGMATENGMLHRNDSADAGINRVGEELLPDMKTEQLAATYREDGSVPFSGHHIHIHTSRGATRGMVTENGTSSNVYGRHQLHTPTTTGRNLATPVNGVGVQDRLPDENGTSSSSSSVERLPRQGRFAFLRRTRGDRRARAKLRVERLKRALEDEQMRQLEGLDEGERRRLIERIEDERMEREKARRVEARRVRNRESVERSRVRERGFEKEVGDEGDVLRWENGQMKAVLEFCRGTAEAVREEVARVLGNRKR